MEESHLLVVNSIEKSINSYDNYKMHYLVNRSNKFLLMHLPILVYQLHLRFCRLRTVFKFLCSKYQTLTLA